MVSKILEIGNENQIFLTLMYALNRELVKPHLNRIVSSYYSEEVTVGLHATRNMESIVRLITEGKTSGGRSKDCRSLLVMIGMCLAKGLGENPVFFQKNYLLYCLSIHD